MFPHLTEKEIVAKVAAYAAEKAALNVANPCIAEDDWNIIAGASGEATSPWAIASVVVECVDDEEVTVVRCGRDGERMFAFPSDEAEKFENIDHAAMTEPTEINITRIRSFDPHAQEIMDICAVHKAELMH